MFMIIDEVFFQLWTNVHWEDTLATLMLTVLIPTRDIHASAGKNLKSFEATAETKLSCIRSVKYLIF